MATTFIGCTNKDPSSKNSASEMQQSSQDNSNQGGNMTNSESNNENALGEAWETASGFSGETSLRGAESKLNSFENLTVWNKQMMDCYLKPYWDSDIIYNETIVFIGETASAKLMYTPTEIGYVKNYRLTDTYIEGVDYTINGNVITRLKGSAMPYWRVEDFYLKEPNCTVVQLKADSSKIDYKFAEDRYLPYYDSDDTFTSRQVTVTYRHNDRYTGPIPTGQTEKLSNFVNKVKSGIPVKVMYYGDSCAVGCNASGTIYGGGISPYMPDSGNMLKYYIENKYGTFLTYENRAVGGWLLKDCIDHYYDAQDNSPQRIPGKNIDLMVLRIGGNDGANNETDYINQMNTLLNMFFSDYPKAELIIQTPELANEEVLGTPYNVDKIDGWTRTIVENSPYKDRIAIADVQAFGKWIQPRKKSRNWLANNINHPNDFFLRTYVQHLLTTIFGEEFTDNI